MAKPGFSRRAGNATGSNADLLRVLDKVKRENISLDSDRDRLDLCLVREDGEPSHVYACITDDAGNLADIALTRGNLRTLAAFLQEHFPNV